MSLLKVAEKAAEITSKIVNYFMIAALAVMFVSLIAQVTLRYVFGLGLFWSDEISRYLMIWIVVLGTSVLLLDDSHIRITVVEELFPERVKRILGMLRYVIACAFAVLILIYSGDMLQSAAHAVSTNMRIPMNIVYFCFPVSSVLMIFYSLLLLIKNFIGLVKKTEITGTEEGSDVV